MPTLILSCLVSCNVLFLLTWIIMVRVEIIIIIHIFQVPLRLLGVLVTSLLSMMEAELYLSALPLLILFTRYCGISMIQMEKE